MPKVAGQTYQWSLGGAVIAGATQDTLRVSKDGVYAVGVQNTFGCSANGSSVIRIVDADIVQSDTTICRGTSIILGPIALKAGQTVLWSNGATTSSIVVNPTINVEPTPIENVINLPEISPVINVLNENQAKTWDFSMEYDQSGRISNIKATRNS